MNMIKNMIKICSVAFLSLLLSASSLFAQTKTFAGADYSQEIRKVSLWIDLLVPQIGDYREANNWSDHDREFYDRYDKKRKQARMEEQENIRQYIQSLQTKQQK
jgi:hypothetical protein